MKPGPAHILLVAGLPLRLGVLERAAAVHGWWKPWIDVFRT
jgi:hypothetical protein